MKQDIDRAGGLQDFYQNDLTAKPLLDYFANRHRSASVTTVDRIQKELGGGDNGSGISRNQIVQVFRELENLGCGTFRVGRRGFQSRFDWKVPMVKVGRMAAAADNAVETKKRAIPNVGATDGDAPALEEHSFKLRRNIAVSIELPIDITAGEAERLAGFIKLIPRE